MFVDQNEIEALLAQAEQLRAEAEAEVATAEAAPPPPPPRPQRPAPRAGGNTELRRILRVRVPVIVRLAARTMPISAIRRLSTGSIVEFDKSVEHDLDLYIRNHRIGHGHAVKVGENFGLRISEIGTQAERIRSMGP